LTQPNGKNFLLSQKHGGGFSKFSLYVALSPVQAAMVLGRIFTSKTLKGLMWITNCLVVISAKFLQAGAF